MSRFVYQSLRYVLLSTYVKVEGKALRILFNGGQLTPNRINGKFSTDDARIQSALESSPEFGKQYTRITPPLVSGPPKVSNTPPPPEPTIKDIDIDGNEDTQPGTAGKQGLTVISGLSKFQEVRQYLMDNIPGITFADVQAKVKALAVIKAHNLQFPDWKENISTE